MYAYFKTMVFSACTRCAGFDYLLSSPQREALARMPAADAVCAAGKAQVALVPYRSNPSALNRALLWPVLTACEGGRKALATEYPEYRTVRRRPSTV